MELKVTMVPFKEDLCARFVIPFTAMVEYTGNIVDSVRKVSPFNGGVVFYL
jgi:hypothetical protein